MSTASLAELANFFSCITTTIFTPAITVKTPSAVRTTFAAESIMKTTWKEIQPVPTSQEFLDIVLSRTQRRLPTQIRVGFKISRIRSMSVADTKA